MKNYLLITTLLATPVVAQITIDSVPFIAESHQAYVLEQDLQLEGQGPAIILEEVVDVTLDFQGHELVIPDGQVGIALEHCSDIMIKQGTIRAHALAEQDESEAVTLEQVNDVTIEDMLFKDTCCGISAGNQHSYNTGLTVRRCCFDLTSPLSTRGIVLGNIRGLLVEDSVFLPTGTVLGTQPIGIYLYNNAAQVCIVGCSFRGQYDRSITVQSINEPGNGYEYEFPSEEIEIDECRFSEGHVIDVDLLGVHDVQVTNSVFSQENGLYHIMHKAGNSPLAGGLQVHTCLFERGTGYSPFGMRASIALEQLPLSTLTVSNSIFPGASANYWDLLVDQSRQALVQECASWEQKFSGLGRDFEIKSLFQPSVSQLRWV